MIFNHLLTICVSLYLCSVSSFSYLYAKESLYPSQEQVSVSHIKTFINSVYIPTQSFSQEKADLLDEKLQNNSLIFPCLKGPHPTISMETRTVTKFTYKIANGQNKNKEWEDFPSELPSPI